MDHEHSKGDDAEIVGEEGPVPDANNHEPAAHDVQVIRAPDSTGEGATDRIGPETRAADAEGGSGVQAANKPDTESGPGKNSRRPWQRWGAKVWASGLAVIITGVVSTFLTGWFTYLFGPPTAVAPSTMPTSHPGGHLPGRQDVSTMAPGRPFYAIPNFYDFHSCGRPCWLPLYQWPTEKSHFVTDGWPCEYYEPDSALADPSVLSRHPDVCQTSGRIRLTGTQVTGST